MNNTRKSSKRRMRALETVLCSFNVVRAACERREISMDFWIDVNGAQITLEDSSGNVAFFHGKTERDVCAQAFELLDITEPKR